MAHSDARAWWADVQYLRDDYERTDEARRRADEADPSFARHRGREADPAGEQHPGHHAALASPPRRGHDVEPVAGSRRGHDVEPVAGWRRDHGVETAAGSHRAPRVPGNAAPDRRTIEIRGRTVPAPALPRATEADRRRQQRRVIERVGTRPDRVAMWALLMGLLLILVAIGTADAPAIVALTLR